MFAPVLMGCWNGERLFAADADLGNLARLPIDPLGPDGVFDSMGFLLIRLVIVFRADLVGILQEFRDITPERGWCILIQNAFPPAYAHTQIFWCMIQIALVESVFTVFRSHHPPFEMGNPINQECGWCIHSGID